MKVTQRRTGYACTQDQSGLTQTNDTAGVIHWLLSGLIAIPPCVMKPLCIIKDRITQANTYVAPQSHYRDENQLHTFTICVYTHNTLEYLCKLIFAGGFLNYESVPIIIYNYGDLDSHSWGSPFSYDTLFLPVSRSGWPPNLPRPTTLSHRVHRSVDVLC